MNKSKMKYDNVNLLFDNHGIVLSFHFIYLGRSPRQDPKHITSKNHIDRKQKHSACHKIETGSTNKTQKKHGSRKREEHRKDYSYTSILSSNQKLRKIISLLTGQDVWKKT